MGTRFRILVLCAVVIGALLALAGPASAAVTITITAPTGTGSYVQCSPISVSWTMSPAVSTGQVGFWIVSPAGTTYADDMCTPTGKASYTRPLAANAPVGTGYSVMMRYRTSSSAPWGAASYSPGTFAITPPVLPFETLVHSHVGDTAVSGKPYQFGFYVLHPDPKATVSSAKIVFTSAQTRRYVSEVTVTGISSYVLETQWLFDPDPAPSNVFLWSRCSLPAGTYRWHVVVTINNETNKMFDEGTLKVTRR